jgi:hypothetical protein
LAWIDGNPAPAVGTLHLPKTPLGQLVHKAYVEQTSLGWNLLFRGFWTISWRTAQEYEYSHCQFTLEFQHNGASWAGRAQMWMFDLFEVAWGLRNTTEHGVDPATQRMIRLAKAERAIYVVLLRLLRAFSGHSRLLRAFLGHYRDSGMLGGFQSQAFRQKKDGRN